MTRLFNIYLFYFPTWNLTLFCSVLNENKLFRNHNALMFENNCELPKENQVSTRYSCKKH